MTNELYQYIPPKDRQPLPIRQLSIGQLLKHGFFGLGNVVEITGEHYVIVQFHTPQKDLHDGVYGVDNVNASRRYESNTVWCFTDKHNYIYSPASTVCFIDDNFVPGEINFSNV